MKCPVCENVIAEKKNFCSFCGWGLVDDVSVHSSLFPEKQLKEYEERIAIYRRIVKRHSNDAETGIQMLKERIRKLEEENTIIRECRKNVSPENCDGDALTSMTSTEAYFKEVMRSGTKINTVDMAFHAGAEWFSDIEKNDLLYELAERGVKIRVILNTPEKSELIAEHMRHKRKRYMSFEECIQSWNAFEKEYAANVEVRLTEIPLLHRYYSIHTMSPVQDSVNVKYYTYANAKTANNYQPIFHCDSDYFQLYRDEFTYLWEKSKPGLNSRED